MTEQGMTNADEFAQARVRVMRRATYGLSALAIIETLAPPEGPFDAAVSNGLAAMIAHHWPGQEFDKKGRVLAPVDLIKKLELLSRGQVSSGNADLRALEEGVLLAQHFRHGRADDEWARLTEVHVAALVRIDRHPSLQVINESTDALVGALSSIDA